MDVDVDVEEKSTAWNIMCRTGMVHVTLVN